MPYSRREILFAAFAGSVYVLFSPIRVLAADPCAVDHPLMPPRKDLSGQCPNCGMVRSMWARTWFMFENSEGKDQACSLHCLADRALKSGEDPKNVQVALYMSPEKMIPAEQAFFVVGSKAKGTMIMKSKIAWASKAEAEKFCKSCGGEVVGFGVFSSLWTHDLIILTEADAARLFGLEKGRDGMGPGRSCPQ